MDPPDARAALARRSSRASWTTCSRRCADFAEFTDGQIDFLPVLDDFNRCQLNTILPTGEQRIDDGALSTGLRNYEEFFQAMVVAGRRVAELRRQRHLRAPPGGRRLSPVQTPPVGAQGPLHASATAAAARHAAGEEPEAALQAEREVPHAAGAGPERRADRGRPVMRQIKKQAPVFVAILFLFVIGARDRRLHPVEPALLPARAGCPCSAPTSTPSRPSCRPARRWSRARARR